MQTVTTAAINRRSFMLGAGASAGLLALPACQSFGGFGMIDAIRRVLLLSSERAFAALTQPGGWYDNQVAKLALGEVLGSRGDVLGSILTSGLVKNALEREFANLAVEGAIRAAPIVYETVRTIGIGNAIALINGGPTAATGFLRQNMGMTLVEAMLPEVGEALRISQEPVVGQLLNLATGTDASAIVGNLVREADNEIWQRIGLEESAIRADPSSTNDPLIMGVFGAL